jgi:type I restriction enzyme M protein
MNMSQVDIAKLNWKIADILRSDPYFTSVDSGVVVFIAALVKYGYTSKVKEVNGKSKELIELAITRRNGLHNELIAEVYHIYSNDLKSLSESSLVSLVKVLNDIRTEDELTQCEIIESLTTYSFDNLSKSPTTAKIPEGLVELMIGLTQAKNDQSKSIYVPFSGIGDLLIGTPECINTEASEQNSRAWAVSKLRFLISKPNSELRIKNDDPIDNWNLRNKKYDYIVTVPPFGLKIGERQSQGKFGYFKSIEQFNIEKGIESLNENGRFVLTIPQGFLFNSDNYSRQLKRFLIDENYLEAVISLPKNIFSFTNIITTVLIFHKSKQSKEVKFIDGSSFVKKDGKLNVLDYQSILSIYESAEKASIYKSVSINEIAANDYNLSVSRYVTDAVEGTPLKELVSVLKASRPEPIGFGKVVKIKNLKNTLADYALDIDEIEVSEISQRHRQINQSCVLIAARFKTCKPTYYEYKGEPIFVDNNVFAIVPNEDKIRVDYFIYLLHTSKVLTQIESLQSGSVTPFISTSDFLRVKVDLPKYADQSKNFEEQARIVTEATDSDLQKISVSESLTAEIDKIKLQYNEELREKQHCIRQHLKNVVDSIAVLNSFMARQNGTIHKDDVINPIRNITVAQRFEAMSKSLQSLSLEVDNLTNDELYDQPELWGIRDILSECVLEFGDTKGFSFQESFDELAFEELGNNNPKISISKRSFKELFNNIVMNAAKHGFVEEKEYLVKIYVTIEDEKLKVSFSNNGKPLAKGLAKQLGIKGKKAGVNSGSGIGVWKVFEIAKHYNFECEILDLPTEEFPVRWMFEFNLTDKD